MVSVLALEDVTLAPLSRVSLSLETGLHVVLAGVADGAARLIDVCAGAALPSSGRVRLDGSAVHEGPASRRSIVSVLADEPRLGPERLDAWLDTVRALRGALDEDELGRLGLDLPRDRRADSLDGGERRRLLLAVALAHPSPRLVALHEPLEAARGGNIERVLGRITELSTRSVVVVTTRDAESARRLGGTPYLLERGVLTRSPAHAWPAELTPGLPPRFAVDSDAPRALMAELSREPSVTALHYDARSAPQRLIVEGQASQGHDAGALALAITDAVRRANATLHALRLEPVDLDIAHSASSGLARAAYDAAHATAQSAWRERVRYERRESAAPPGAHDE